MNNLSQASTILKENLYCCLATASKTGEPWNSPVFYSYDPDLNLYWASAMESIHSQFLKENPMAFIVIYDSTAAPRTATALYLQGSVRQVDDDRLDALIQQHFKRVNEEALFTGDNYRDSSPERLYQFSPQRVWLLGKPYAQQGHLIDNRIELSREELRHCLAKAIQCLPEAGISAPSQKRE